jgi:hypothetical protein
VHSAEHTVTLQAQAWSCTGARTDPYDPYESTDFWQRAERAKITAAERENREKELVKAREEKEAEKKDEDREEEKVRKCHSSSTLHIQVLDDGCLVRVLNDNYTIFTELKGSDLAQGQRYELKAEKWGTFKCRTVLGAPSTLSAGLLSRSRIEVGETLRRICWRRSRAF